MGLSDLSNQIAQVNPQLAAYIQKNPMFLPFVISELILKLIFYPIALYTAAKNRQKAWFVVLFICMLVLNDFALLPILYLIFQKRMQAAQKPQQELSKLKVKGKKKKL